MSRKPRIAILAHSTNPRGGVVHALELGDALSRLGYEDDGFCSRRHRRRVLSREPVQPVRVAASPVGRDVRRMVETRVADYVRHFERAENRRFDAWHAQDGISGNALATLKQRGLIPGFARTVHHVDSFDDERLRTLQLRAMAAADHLFVVSRLWRDWLARELGREACHVGNGVDTRRFAPVPDQTDDELRARLDLPPGAPVFLAVGGIEERKNSIRLLQAFQTLRLQHPSARLVIAGGASLLDHGAYQARFAGMLAHSGGSAGRGDPHRADAAAIDAGALSRRDRAGLSLDQGRLRPGRSGGDGEWHSRRDLADRTVHRVSRRTRREWCDPFDVASIATAMTHSLDAAQRATLIARGLQIAARHDWNDTARAHLSVYGKLREPAHA